MAAHANYGNPNEEPHFKSPLNKEILFNLESWAEATIAGATNAGQVDAMTIHPDQTSPIADNIPLSAKGDPDFNECYEENLKALYNIKNPMAPVSYKEISNT